MSHSFFHMVYRSNKNFCTLFSKSQICFSWITEGHIIEPNNDPSKILVWNLAVELLMGVTIPKRIDPDDRSKNYVIN